MKVHLQYGRAGLDVEVPGADPGGDGADRGRISGAATIERLTAAVEMRELV